MARIKVIADAFKPVMLDMDKGLHREYMLQGGRGSTKSSFASIAIVLGIKEDDRANAIVYRRVANTIKDSVFEQMMWAIDVLRLNDEFKVRRSPFEIERKKTGQRILFRGLDDPAKSKSIKLKRGHYFKYLWLEELSEFRGMEDVRSIKQSVFRGVDKAFTIFTYNPPKSASCWVNKEAMKTVPDRLVHKSCYLDVPAEWLGAEFLAGAETLKATNERAYQNEYLGDITGTGGNVFENITLRPITEEDLKQRSNLYSGIDWGWFPDPFHFCRCSYDAAQRRLWIWDEWRTVRTSNMDAFKYLAENKGLKAGEMVIADSAEHKSVSDMRSYGMNCVGATKGPGSVRASMKWLQSLKEIIIDPVRCPEAAKEFVSYEYEQNKDGEFVDAYPDKNNHGIDAVRYATNTIWLNAGA